MIKFITRYAFAFLVIGGLTILGSSIKVLFNWSMLANFFIVLRSVVKPLEFMWDFETSFLLIGRIILIYMAYYSFKVVLLTKSLFFDKN